MTFTVYTLYIIINYVIALLLYESVYDCTNVYYHYDIIMYYNIIRVYRAIEISRYQDVAGNNVEKVVGIYDPRRFFSKLFDPSVYTRRLSIRSLYKYRRIFNPFFFFIHAREKII